MVGGPELLIFVAVVVVIVLGISWLVRRRRRSSPQSKGVDTSWRDLEEGVVERAGRPGPSVWSSLADPFASVARQVEELRQEVTAGRLTEEACKARMRELMVEDAKGDWWMVGYETGEWYRHDGSDWVRGDPQAVGGGKSGGTG